MTDQYGRVIDYLRISITDRCNLRCRYCMPHGIPPVSHEDILRYEELLSFARIAVSLGITRFKITGGEPLVRDGCTDFLAALKRLPGVERVTLTTNGVLLSRALDALAAAPADGVNVSLDSRNDAVYSRLTGAPSGTAQAVVRAVKECVARSIPTKINAVLLPETLDDLPDLAALAAELPVDVRFIELMPIGEGANRSGVPADRALERLTARWPDLHPTGERRGNGPAVYYAADGLLGRIGLIGAVSHRFCADCNRVRLTGQGKLKPCLAYDEGIELRDLLRHHASEDEIRASMRDCIYHKPERHGFDHASGVTERQLMSQIGG